MRFSRTWLAVFWFATLSGIFYSPFLLFGRDYYPAGFLYRTPLWYDASVPLQNFDLLDAIIQYYPNDHLYNEGVKQGHIPGWSPYNFCGHPLLANGQTGFLYPPRILLHALFSTTTAHDLMLVLHTFLAGFAMYLFAAALGLSWPASLLCGTAWMFNGNSLAWLELEFSPTCSALIPLALYALERASERRAWCVGAAFLVGALTVCGHLQFVLYGLIVVFSVGLYRAFTAPERTHAIRRLLLVFVAGFALATPVLLPTSELLRASQRPYIPLTAQMTWSAFALLTAPVTLVAPDAYGNPVDGFALMRVPHGAHWVYPELSIYLGIVPLLLAYLGAASAMRPGPPRFFCGMALLTLLLPVTPLYGLLYLLPGFSRIVATRGLVMFIFASVLLAGYGFDRLSAISRSRRVLQRGALLLFVLWGALVLVIHALPARDAVNYLLASNCVRLPDRELFLTDDAYRAAVLDSFQHVYAWNAPSIFCPLIWLAAFIGVLRLPRPVPWMLLLTAADLMVFGLRFNPTVPSSRIYPTPAEVGYMQRTVGYDRVMGVGTIKPDTLLPFRLQDIGGYDSFYPREAGETLFYLRFGRMPRSGEMIPPQMFPITRYRSGLIDLMGVRYLVAYPGETLAGMTPVRQTGSILPLFENPHRLPRAFVVRRCRIVSERSTALSMLDDSEFDARHEVLLDQPPPRGPTASPALDDASTPIIRSYAPDRVVIDASTRAPGWLILTDTFSPGWNVTVDGRPSEVLRGDVMFRAVPLSAGAHRVVFDYEPPGLRLGLVICASTAALLIVWTILPMLRWPRSQG